MNEIIEKETIHVENMIYKIDGVEVMLDNDLAKIYQVETKRINEAVKNNPEKFPSRYLFRISESEYNSLKSKISTSKGGSRKGHTAFTEQGIYMLATILKSKVATEVSIRIMDTFVRMRHYINLNANLLPNRVLLLEEKVDKNTKRIDELFDKFDPKVIVNEFAFFKGNFYDPYSLVLNIIEEAKKEIIIVDNYAGKELLDMLKNVSKKIIIISQNIDDVLKEKYEKQYHNITFINSAAFHDRFIIIDREKLYSCGSSFKDMGKKCFIINKVNTKSILESVLEIIDLK